jgi:hypothetical protein
MIPLPHTSTASRLTKGTYQNDQRGSLAMKKDRFREFQGKSRSAIGPQGWIRKGGDQLGRQA